VCWHVPDSLIALFPSLLVWLLMVLVLLWVMQIVLALTPIDPIIGITPALAP
jgi:hypothetical protein